MTHLKVLRPVCILVALLAVVALQTGGTTRAAQARAATPAASQCGKWNVIGSPSIELGVSQLNAVAAVSTTDVWAVGFSNSISQTLIEQWNGSQWQIVSSPNVNTTNALYGIAALSANDVWAAGFSSDINGNSATLIEHWDGTKWSVIPSPNQTGSANDILMSMSAVSASDIWAVGYYGTASYTPQKTLTEHWNGTQWSIVKSPNVDKGGDASTELYGVSAVASNDVWAVGYDNILDYHAVIEHWNGKQWSISSHPNFSAQAHAVVGVAHNNAWAVGITVGAQTFTDHWNGSSWQVVQSPTPHGINYLAGIAANGASDLWSVGWDEVGQIDKPDTEHWNGTKWKLVASPNPGGDSQLFAVSITPAAQVWAVGAYAINRNHTVFDPLIEYYC